MLDPAIKQINVDPMGAGFSVDYEPIRKGRFYHEILFKLTKTDARKAVDRQIKQNGEYKKKIANGGNQLVIKPWAETKGQQIAARLGRSYSELLREWQEWAADKEPPKDPSAAFIAFCNQKPSMR